MTNKVLGSEEHYFGTNPHVPLRDPLPFAFDNLHGAYMEGVGILFQQIHEVDLHSTTSQPTLEQRIMFRGDLESRIKLG